MRLAFVIHTPGQANFWRNPILMLQDKGDDVLVISRKNKSICDLLTNYNIEFNTYGKAGKSVTKKIAQLPIHFLNSFRHIKRFSPDIIVGTGVIEAYSSLFLRKPCVIFEDTEGTPYLERIQWKTLASVILTPECFMKDLGKKQVRFAGYKELSYLHPNRFNPDPVIYDELKLKRGEKYAILRFNSFDAVHDVGRHGFTTEDQIHLVKELEKFVHVFISPEAPLPRDFEKYRLPTPYHRIHHALYYAQIFVSDTGTATVEAALLGTPAVMCATSGISFGNFTELDQKYGLLFNCSQAQQTMHKAIELIQQSGLKEQWAKKRQKMLADKVDVAQFVTDFIETYSENFQKSKIKRAKDHVR